MTVKTQAYKHFFIMPVQIYNRTDINSNDKMVYAYLLSTFLFFSKQNKEYAPTHPYVANKLGLDLGELLESLAKLESLGLVSTVRINSYNQPVYTVKTITE